MYAARVLIGLCLLSVHAPRGHTSPTDVDYHLFSEYHSRSRGCNGNVDGIPCCDDGFILGDNDNGDEEMFIQAGDYRFSCLETCKSLYKNSIGITESLKQQYSSGNGKNMNKCWCEFGDVKLDAANKNYRTCVFAAAPSTLAPDSVVDPVAEPVKKEIDHVEERAAFHEADKDGDGKLTSEEAVELFKMTEDDPSITDETHLISWMAIFIDTLDENGNEMLDYDEVDWTAFDDKSEQPTKEEAEDIARSTVKLYDEDGNGKLNMEEFFKVLKVFSPTLSRQQAAIMLPKLDQDGDGQLNLTEFLVFFIQN